MNHVLKILTVCLLCANSGFLLFSVVSAKSSSPDLVINEIAWMGTETSYSNEWIELYNTSDYSVDLKAWTLKAADGTPEIKLASKILGAHDYYLLERTDDSTLPQISADQIYTGVLENAGENLNLYDNEGNLINSVNCSSGWFAGNNKTKQTMERKWQESGSDSSYWKSSQNPGGTPKAENSTSTETITEKQNPESNIQPESQSTKKAHCSHTVQSKTASSTSNTVSSSQPGPITYPSNIVINEILPSPIGADATQEWIEIFNSNNFEVDLSNWKITDLIGKTRLYSFPKPTLIAPRGFLVLSRKSTGITLNNGMDGLNLSQPDGKIIDSVNYQKALRARSYNLTEKGWIWSTTLTPGSANIISIPIQKTKKTKITKNAATKKKIKKSLTKKKPANDSSPNQSSMDNQIPKSFSIFLISFLIAIFSGIMLLILKKRLKSQIKPW